MTRKQARIGLVISLLLTLGASRQAAQGPADLYNRPVEAFFLFFGPLISLVFLVLSFVGRKDKLASAIDATGFSLGKAEGRYELGARGRSGPPPGGRGWVTLAGWRNRS
ncbi:hypothetical protein [Actinomadura sp. 9N215]|uniref:hypothetical protein n=1 Tax=Actinomadura sp. 9N215 TaxID=3375150 RepID=UPI0037B5F436